ncbi:MAG: DUF962 domain-containing protein [Elusimicrobia bacterium]|nr:DUF962 domain-containing protein [Elusimicrobiota bacterium]
MDYPALSADYARYHRARGNRICHAVGIPLIGYAVTAWSCFGTGLPATALLLPIYFRWDRRIGLMLTAFIAVSAALAAVLPGWTSGAAFVVGWILQFAGHALYEKKSPAFTKNLDHLLVGPAWIAAELAGLKTP